MSNKCVKYQFEQIYYLYNFYNYHFYITNGHEILTYLQKDAFEKWLLQEPKEHEAHAKSFGRRALHEKVANDLGGNLQKQNRHGIRKSYNKGKTEYIDDASSVYSVKGGFQLEFKYKPGYKSHDLL